MHPHLVVPNSEVQNTIDLLTAEGWMGDNLRIHASPDRDTRLIPLSIQAPQALPPPLNEPEVAPSEFAVNTVSLSFGAAKVELQVATQIRRQIIICSKALIVFSLFVPST